MIVLLDPTSDAGPRFFQAAVLRRPDFLFLQAAMEPFNVAVAFRVMIRRPAVRDAEPRGSSSYYLTGVDQPQKVDAMLVTEDYFRLFGLPITQGRGFTSEE